MKKLLSLAIALLLTLSIANAQENSQEEPAINIDKMSLGLGMGFDYGGFGANLLFYPQRNIGLFAGGGYALAGAGYNVGAKIRLMSENSSARFTPYLIGMYGYHTAIKVANASKYDKLFYGFTAGVGFDYRRNIASDGFWSFELLIPMRQAEVDEYMNDLEKVGIVFENSLPPVGISIGYHFIIK